MVDVRFTQEFEKSLKKSCSKAQAKTFVRKLSTTRPTDGDYISLVGGVLLKERKMSSFRFYFVQDATRIEFLSEEELRKRIITFVALSKKNNQQAVIDKLKDDLRKAGL